MFSTAFIMMEEINGGLTSKEPPSGNVLSKLAFLFLMSNTSKNDPRLPNPPSVSVNAEQNGARRQFNGDAKHSKVALTPLVADKVARWQNLIPSFPWIAPGWTAWGRNPRKGRDQILQLSVAEP